MLKLRRRGDPRLVPCFRWYSLSTRCPPGSRVVHRLHAPSSFADDTGLRPKRRVSALPSSHTPILVGGFISGLTYGSLSLRPVDLLAPLVGADQAISRPTEAFTSGLSTAWSPAPSPDITTGATGQAPLTGLSPVRTPTSIAATAYRTGQAELPHLGKNARFTRSLPFPRRRPSPGYRWSAPALPVSRPAQRSLGLQPADLPSRLMPPSTPEAPAALLSPPPLRLLPGGAIPFPGGSSSRCGPVPLHVAL